MPSSVRSRERPAAPCGSCSRASIGRPGAAHRRSGSRDLGRARTPPAPASPVRSPFFLLDLLHDLDGQVPLGHQPLQPLVLELKLLEAPNVRDLHPAVLLLPAVEGLLADAVLAAHRCRRQTAGLSLPKDPDDLLFLEPGFAHRISSAREILSQWLVRNSESTSASRSTRVASASADESPFEFSPEGSSFLGRTRGREDGVPLVARMTPCGPNSTLNRVAGPGPSPPRWPLAAPATAQQ